MTDPLLAEVIESSVLAERRARRFARSLGDALADARRLTLAGEQAAIGSLRAAHAARASQLATLEAELEAARSERDSLAAQLLATRDERDRLAADLAAERETRRALAAELTSARASERETREALDAALESARAQERRLETAVASERQAHRAVEADVERHARIQAAAAAARPSRPVGDAARIAADLDRAAATLRARIGPEGGQGESGTPPAGEPDAAVATVTPVAASAATSGDLRAPAAAGAPPEGGEPDHAPVLAVEPPAPGGAPRPAPIVAAPARRRLPQGPSLRAALVSLARRDPAAAGELLVGLLPAQGPIVAASVDYDLTIRGTGTFAVTLAGGAAEVRPLEAPRGRREADFHLTGEPLALAELLAGDRRRVSRLGRQVRISGRKRRAEPLTAIQRAHVRLADLARAGATLDPLAALRALPEAVPPSWTVGHAFTIEHVVAGDPPRSLVLRARDGQGLEALDALEGGRPDATVRLTPETFAAMLAEAPVLAGRRPAIRGDWQAVAVLLRWADQARRR